MGATMTTPTKTFSEKMQAAQDHATNGSPALASLALDKSIGYAQGVHDLTQSEQWAQRSAWAVSCQAALTILKVRGRL